MGKGKPATPSGHPKYPLFLTAIPTPAWSGIRGNWCTIRRRPGDLRVVREDPAIRTERKVTYKRSRRRFPLDDHSKESD